MGRLRSRKVCFADGHLFLMYHTGIDGIMHDIFILDFPINHIA